MGGLSSLSKSWPDTQSPSAHVSPVEQSESAVQRSRHTPLSGDPHVAIRSQLAPETSSHVSLHAWVQRPHEHDRRFVQSASVVHAVSAVAPSGAGFTSLPHETPASPAIAAANVSLHAQRMFSFLSSNAAAASDRDTSRVRRNIVLAFERDDVQQRFTRLAQRLSPT
jgi:hypothetical protein